MDSQILHPLISDETNKTIAHVLFIDAVGFSQLSLDKQHVVLQQLRRIAWNSTICRKAREEEELLTLPSGDGMALVFFGDASLALEAAIELTKAISTQESIPFRMGIHTGEISRVADVNGAETVVGSGINLAERVMSCGDSKHILVSSEYAKSIEHFYHFTAHLRNCGPITVKHGHVIRLLNYYDGIYGNPIFSPRAANIPSVTGKRVVIVYRRNTLPDTVLLQTLHDRLAERGCEVFIDQHLNIGLEWARAIEIAIRSADSVIAILSPNSAKSEMLAFELEIANESAKNNYGRPLLLPVRIDWEGALPETLAKLLNPIQYTLWTNDDDNQRVIDELCRSMADDQKLPMAKLRRLETPGGAIPINSNFYISRETDEECNAAMERAESFIRIEGPRQIGKTSLLCRTLQRARGFGWQVAYTDFQKLNNSNLDSLEQFYITIAHSLARQLNIEASPEAYWTSKGAPNENFECYIKEAILGSTSKHVVWVMDEVDRLFSTHFISEFFGLLRSWHNARAFDLQESWCRLTMILSYATECQAFITDRNQSPFNVGSKIHLSHFSVKEVALLNDRHGGLLKTERDVDRLMRLVDGHPFLTRKALYEIANRKLDLDGLEKKCTHEDGPFSDHLKRLLFTVSRNQTALIAIRDLLKSKQGMDSKLFYHLKGSGILKGATATDASFKCDLYRKYLSLHLL